MAFLAGDLVASMRYGTLQVYPNLGHFGPLQDPVTIAADVGAFFSRG
jgi:hypothetical protein